MQLRQKMQIELRSLQRNLGITFIFVTHDQGEALSMSDRLAVFNKGRVAQLGTPREIYEYPTSRFVAQFVGDSNIIEGRISGSPVEFDGIFSLRPERIRVSSAEPAAAVDELVVTGVVVDVQFHGASVRHLVSLEDGSSIQAVSVNQESNTGASSRDIGSPIWLTWRRDEMHRLDESPR